MEGLDENIHPLKTKTLFLSFFVKSLTWIYALTSGLSSNFESEHLILFIAKSL